MVLSSERTLHVDTERFSSVKLAESCGALGLKPSYDRCAIYYVHSIDFVSFFFSSHGLCQQYSAKFGSRGSQYTKRVGGMVSHHLIGGIRGCIIKSEQIMLVGGLYYCVVFLQRVQHIL